MLRAIGHAGLAVAVGMAGYVAPAVGQEARPVAPAARGRFVEIPGFVINIDQIQFVQLFSNGGEPTQSIVRFGSNTNTIQLDADRTRQLLAAIRDRDAGPPAAPRPIAFDGFDGKLGLDWKPVRPDPSHVSLAKNPGKLTITTQRGSIHGEAAKDEAGEPIPARNLYLIDNPMAGGADFVATTRVDGFTPETSYQQAGLIVYEDDDNYLKWGYEYNWRESGGQTFYGVAEKDAVPTHYPVESESGLKQFWLRLTKRGDRYEFASSLDGKTYRVHGEAAWGDGSPKRLGILAKNGGSKDAGELDAAFDFFEVRALAPGPKKE